MSKSGVLVVFVTVPDQDTANKIAKSVIEQRLAACVNIFPGIESLFHWQGKVDTAKELLLVMKTKDSLYSALEQAVVEAHPYDTPEVLALEASDVFEKYRDWVLKETRSG